MTWDLIQNIIIVLLILWNLSIVAGATRNDRYLMRQIRRSSRR